MIPHHPTCRIDPGNDTSSPRLIPLPCATWEGLVRGGVERKGRMKDDEMDEGEPPTQKGRHGIAGKGTYVGA
jgi:hypothetical protein